MNDFGRSWDLLYFILKKFYQVLSNSCIAQIMVEGRLRDEKAGEAIVYRQKLPVIQNLVARAVIEFPSEEYFTRQTD